MPLGDDIVSAYLGSTLISRVYRGSSLIASFSETGGTETVSIATGADDADQVLSTGAMNLTATSLVINATRKAGLRFHVETPQGRTITACTITFRGSGSFDSNTLRITGHAHDASPAFTTASNNISSRTNTAEFVDWVAPSTTFGSTATTSSLTTIAQAIVNRPSFNGILTFFFVRPSTGTNWNPASFESSQPGPSLTITWS